MFCPKCGAAVAEGTYFCPKCGADIQNQPAAGVPGGGVTPVPQYTGPQQNSGKAIGSLICGLLPFFLLTPIIAIVLGHLALSEIKRSAGRLKGKGMAIAGLVLGYGSIAMLPLVLIIAAIAIPNLLRAKIAANESSAAASVRSIVTAEMSYSSTHTDKGYTCSLSDLKDDALIDQQLSGGAKYGFVFELLECKPAQDGGPNTQFRVIAYPVTKGSTGNRAFCSDESAVVRYDTSGSGQNCLDVGKPIGE